MENYTRIYLEGFGDLELYKNVPISLNYSVAEIQDISKKNTSFSKTINIPGTKENNEILGQLFDISIADSSFDINAKVACKIYGADITLMKGYFRLMGINKISASSIGGEELIEYEALVFDQTTDFYDKLSDRLLSDLDFSQHNHTYGYSAIVGSSAHTSDDIYTYPMLYNENTNYYNTKDFQPAIYLKAYIDLAFQTVEYSYDSEFFESDYFKSLIIPFNGEKSYNSQTIINGRKFQVGISGATDFVQFSGSQSGFTSYSGYTMPFNSDNNTSVPYFDSGSTFNTTTYKFTSDSNQTFDLRFRVNAHSFATNPHAQSIKLYDSLGQAVLSSAKINCVARLYKNGVLAVGPSTSPNLMNVSIGNTIVSSGSTATGITTLDYTFSNITAGIGDQFEVRLKPGVTMPIQSIWRLGPAYGSATPYYPNITVKLDISATGQTNGNNFLLNSPHLGELGDGDTVELNNFIPKQQKIKDVFSSVLKMFNLYVEQDASYENKLIIKTRQDYYSGNTYSDWTPKLAIDKDINIKFIPELQNKDLILTYKQDSDALNKAYFDQTKEVYGQKKYIFDNDFLSGQKKVELIFSPTPLKKNGFGLTVSGILSQSPKNNIRILYKPDSWTTQTGLTWNYRYTTTGGTVATSTFTSYPYAGHFDRPQFPTEDINFGQVEYMYYTDYGNITDNNLANKYYFNQVDQMLEGKLLTAYFDLSYTDILNLRFSDKVFIKDAYYIINKIQDFNPIEDGLTKVELLKVDDGLKFRTRNKKPVRPHVIAGVFLNTGTTVGVTSPTRPTVKGEILNKYNPFTLNTGSVILGNNTGNIVNSNKSVVSGEGNFVEESTRAFIIGDDNTADGGTKTMIIGSGNTASNDSANIIVGNDNLIPNGVESVFIIGNSITASTDYTLYTNNIEMSSGSTLNGYTIDQLTSGGGTGTTDQYWTSGSTGTNSIRANNATGLDATGDYAVAQGYNTLASGYASHAEGSTTIASGDSAHAEGYQTEANGQFAHAEGYDTRANGDWSHAEGAFTIASGLYSHAEGGNTLATSAYTHAQGHYTQATGYASHAGGWNSVASGDFAFVHGSQSRATADNINVLGRQITGTTADTTYVDNFNIKTVGAGTPIINLGVDSSGNVVTGSTFSGVGTFLPLSGGTMTGDITSVFNKGIKYNSTTNIKFEGALGYTGTSINGNLGNAYILVGNRYDGGVELGSYQASSVLGLYTNTSSIELYDSAETVINDNTIVAIGVDTNRDITIADNTTAHRITTNTNKKAVFIGSKNSKINSGVTNSVVIGGEAITATTSSTVYVPNLYITGTTVGAPYDNVMAISDETTAITSGTSKLTFYVPRNFTLQKVKVSLTTSGSTTTKIDVNYNGTSVLSSPPISLTSGVFVNSTTSLATTAFVEDNKVTIDIDEAGTGAKGAKVYLIGRTS